MKLNEVKFKAKGMHCISCETLIEKAVNGIDGVKNTKVDYATEICEVSFDPDKVNIVEIFKVIEGKGYDCSLIEDKKSNCYNINVKSIGIIFGIIGILVIGYFIFRLADGIALPEISQNMSYGLLFIVGLLKE